MLVDGNPADWQNHLEFLGDVNSSQFNQTLLKEIFSFAPKVRSSIINDAIGLLGQRNYWTHFFFPPSFKDET